MEKEPETSLQASRETPDMNAPSSPPAEPGTTPARSMIRQPSTQIETASGFKQISAAEVIEKRPGRIVVEPITGLRECLGEEAKAADLAPNDKVPLTIGYRMQDGRLHIAFSKGINVLILDRNQAITFGNAIKKHAMDMPFDVGAERAPGKK